MLTAGMWITGENSGRPSPIQKPKSIPIQTFIQHVSLEYLLVDLQLKYGMLK